MDFNDRFAALLHTHLRRYHEFTDIEANNEVYYVMTFIGVERLLKGDDLKYGNRAYVYPDYPRHGRYKPLDRAKKVSIALTINNCLNYAEFPVAESTLGA